MEDTFDIQDKLFSLFIADNVLTRLVGIVDATDIAMCDVKMRRQQQDMTLLTTKMLDFFDFTFIDSDRSRNYMVNHGIMEFNIYCSLRNNAGLISKAIKRILRDNFEDMQVYSEGQVGCPIENIICYRIRVRPMLSS